jgi:sugar phosphate isomerase/epimerase
VKFESNQKELAEMLATELWWGTIPRITLEGFAVVAGKAGFDFIAVNTRQCRDVLSDASRFAQIQSVLADAGVRVSCLDALSQGLPGVPTKEALTAEDRKFFERVFHLFEFDADACFEVAVELEIPLVNLVYPLGQADNQDELLEAVGRINERAESLGIALCLEFVPGSGIPTLEAAARIRNAVSANIGICLDSWHLARTGETPADVRALEPGAIKAVQLNDRKGNEGGPFDGPNGPTFTRLAERRLPGDGELPLAELVEALLANNPQVPIGVEVFSPKLEAMAPQEAAMRAADSLRSIVEQVDGQPGEVE